MNSVTIQLDRRFSKVAKGVYEKYYFDVGILQNANHRMPVPSTKGLSNYAGGPVRKKAKAGNTDLNQVSESLRSNLRVNFYTKPFKSAKNKDILVFLKSFFDLCAGRSEAKRAENLLQAVVRNPILRGDYGRNKPLTAKIKGFNRLMFDTGQLFKGIKAKVSKKRVS